MKKLIAILILISVVYIHAEEKLGKAISLKEKTSVSKILSSPESFEGKTVLVEGIISKVDTKAATEHKDKKEGEKDDCATEAVYQIKGLGAVIK